ncbi:MAG: FAD binding domain-containing protein [Paracoccaceae bacterium]
MYMATNTHILVPEFDYQRPGNLQELLTLMAEHGDRARLIAGGTDLVVQMKMERVRPSLVISLAGIEKLRGVTLRDGLNIGAMATIRDVAGSAAVRGKYRALYEACQAFSTVQIMIMGTIGGNLCNASPAADTAPALLAFDARVDLVTDGGCRSVPIGEFFTGPGQTVLARGEVMQSVKLPEPEEGTGSAFLKVSRVVADIAQVCAAVRLVRDGDRVTDCRIALGAVAPTPMRIGRAEECLTGGGGDEGAFERAAGIAADDIRPISDIRATAAYRRHATRVIVRDALTTAWQRAGEGGGT